MEVLRMKMNGTVLVVAIVRASSSSQKHCDDS